MFALLDGPRPATGNHAARLRQWALGHGGLAAFLALGIALLALTCLPVLQERIPPLVDYVNHLARIYVIAEHGNDAILSQFYGVHWRLIPNLAMDIVVTPLVAAFGIYGAGKLFVLASIAMLVTGPHAVYRALYGRLSPWPFVACLFIYSESFNGGLMNYLFGVGLALWGIAAWIALTRAPTILRAAVSVGFICTLYLCHLAAAGTYVVAVLSVELWRARSDPKGYRADLARNVVPFLLPILALGVLHHFQPAASVHQALRWTLEGKVRGITWSFESEQMFRIPDALISLGIIAAIGCLAWRRSSLRLHPAAVPFAIAALVAFFAAPAEIMGASGVDSRLPIAFLLVLIGFLDWDLPTVRARAAFSLALMLLLAAKIGLVDYVWRAMAVDTAEMMQSAAAIKRGSKILVVQEDHPSYRGASWLYYLPCVMIIERSSLVSLAYSDPTQQVLTVKPPFRAMTGGFNDDPPSLSELVSIPTQSPSAPSGRIYWANWKRNYDYVYVVSLNGESPSVPASLKEIYAAHHFRLYAVERAVTSALLRRDH